MSKVNVSYPDYTNPAVNPWKDVQMCLWGMNPNGTCIPKDFKPGEWKASATIITAGSNYTTAINDLCPGADISDVYLAVGIELEIVNWCTVDCFLKVL